MLTRDLKHFRLIPATAPNEIVPSVPERPGVYLFFFARGVQLLEAASFVDTSALPILQIKRHDHLYTGAAQFSLRQRLYANVRSDITSSSLCRSLLAMEQKCKAISRSGTPACAVRGERTLSQWIRKNALIAIEETRDPYGREQELLFRFSSPLNIAHRRQRPFARMLSAWRCAAFPADRPERAQKKRHT